MAEEQKETFEEAPEHLKERAQKICGLLLQLPNFDERMQPFFSNAAMLADIHAHPEKLTEEEVRKAANDALQAERLMREAREKKTIFEKIKTILGQDVFKEVILKNRYLHVMEEINALIQDVEKHIGASSPSKKLIGADDIDPILKRSFEALNFEMPEIFLPKVEILDRIFFSSGGIEAFGINVVRQAFFSCCEEKGRGQEASQVLKVLADEAKSAAAAAPLEKSEAEIIISFIEKRKIDYLSLAQFMLGDAHKREQKLMQTILEEGYVDKDKDTDKDKDKDRLHESDDDGEEVPENPPSSLFDLFASSCSSGLIIRSLLSLWKAEFRESEKSHALPFNLEEFIQLKSQDATTNAMVLAEQVLKEKISEKQIAKYPKIFVLLREKLAQEIEHDSKQQLEGYLQDSVYARSVFLKNKWRIRFAFLWAAALLIFLAIMLLPPLSLSLEGLIAALIGSSIFIVGGVTYGFGMTNQLSPKAKQICITLFAMLPILAVGTLAIFSEFGLLGPINSALGHSLSEAFKPLLGSLLGGQIAVAVLVLIGVGVTLYMLHRARKKLGTMDRTKLFLQRSIEGEGNQNSIQIYEKNAERKQNISYVFICAGLLLGAGLLFIEELARLSLFMLASSNFVLFVTSPLFLFIAIPAAFIAVGLLAVGAGLYSESSGELMRVKRLPEQQPIAPLLLANGGRSSYCGPGGKLDLGPNLLALVVDRACEESQQWLLDTQVDPRAGKESQQGLLDTQADASSPGHPIPQPSTAFVNA